AAESRSRFERDVRRARPAYVIILAGVNDIFRGSGAESVERELGLMYADALDASIVPVAASVLPYDLATPQATAAIFTLNMWIESFAKVLDIPFADTHAAAAAPSAPHRLRGSPDGLHPAVAGYRRMGDTPAPPLDAHLAPPAPRCGRERPLPVPRPPRWRRPQAPLRRKAPTRPR